MSLEEIGAQFSFQYAKKDAQHFALEVDLTLPGEGVTGIFGHSGSGKTTLLRCIAGLQRPPQGRLVVNGQVWQGARRFLPTHKRPLGYVFQEASLFPHLSVQGNLKYAMRRADGARNPHNFQEAAKLLGIERLLNRYPAQLSGGERQRVAIARALLIRPRLLLMDEPLAALDQARKAEILPYLERLRHELAIPILYVTHSADEVARLADHVLILNEGRVLAQGPLKEMQSRLDLPVRLADYTGVVLEGRVIERDPRWRLARIRFGESDLWVRDTGDGIGESVRVRILARDVSIARSAHEDSSIVNRLPARVVEIAEADDHAMRLVKLQVGEATIIARITYFSAHHLNLKPDAAVWAQVKSVAIVR